MTTIIALSGKKQSGKSSLAEYIRVHTELTTLSWLLIQQDNVGNVSIKALPDALFPGKIYNSSHVPQNRCKIYSFADPIKELCIDVLGLTPEQVNGTDEQKNSLTKYKWENFPCPQIATPTASGSMTARQIMQIIGTDIFRKMFSQDVWVDTCFRRIAKNKPKFAIIADVRFPSEVEAIVKNDGYVIRLSRTLFKDDQHPSETALDDYDWSKLPKCLVVPDGSIAEKNKFVMNRIESMLLENTKNEQQSV